MQPQSFDKWILKSSWQRTQPEWLLPCHFLFNIRNYSCEVRNIQQRKAELNINLTRVNNFDIKQKKVWKWSFRLCALSTGLQYSSAKWLLRQSFFNCWLEWFDADRAVRGNVSSPPLLLGQSFHRYFIGQVLSIDGY